MAPIRHPTDKLHPNIKREVAEAFLQRWVKAAELTGKNNFSRDDAAWVAENNPDYVLQAEFGGWWGDKSGWNRLEAHLAKTYAGKTTIISAEDRPAPRLPAPDGYQGWLPLGAKDYPDPNFCSELEGLLAFKVRWPLFRMGVPLDLRFPISWEDGCAAHAAAYERKRIRPLLCRIRRHASMIARLSNQLVDAEKTNPRYATYLGREPDLEHSRLKTFRGLGNLAHFAERLMDELPRSRRGPKKKYSKDELIRRLKAAGLSDAKIGESLWLLGLEGAGDRKDRVRQCRRRMKG